MLTVVKMGGRLVSEPEALACVADSVAAMRGDVIVVHGGGNEVSTWQERIGIPVQWRNGLRVTSTAGLQVVSMVLSGWTNKRLVAALERAGLSAVGVSGEDGGLVVAFPKDGGSLGEVGTVAAIQPRVLEALLRGGFVPVISPVSTGPDGPLNVNADEVASALAVALGADRLLLTSDAPGVLRDGVVLPELDVSGAHRLLDSGVAEGGMAVKLASAISAVNSGIQVAIGDGGILKGEGGTGMAAVSVSEGAA